MLESGCSQAKDKTTSIIGLFNQMDQPNPLFALSMHWLVVLDFCSQVPFCFYVTFWVAD
jgi:hypothetical protein